MKRQETVDYNIKAAWHAISRMYNTEAAKHEMTTSIGFVLLNIDVENGTPATRIAPLLGLESRSLTRILKTIEEKGWVYRETDEKDKRFVKIHLTEAGKAKREVARKTVKDFNYLVLENISSEKLGVFFEVIQEIGRLVDQNRKQELITESATI